MGAVCHVSPGSHTRLRHGLALGRWPDLERPTTFDEKLQWLNLYWQNPLKVRCGDKFALRSFIEEHQEEILECTQKLSLRFPFVRLDEMTFTFYSGCVRKPVYDRPCAAGTGAYYSASAASHVNATGDGRTRAISRMGPLPVVGQDYNFGAAMTVLWGPQAVSRFQLPIQTALILVCGWATSRPPHGPHLANIRPLKRYRLLGRAKDRARRTGSLIHFASRSPTIRR